MKPEAQRIAIAEACGWAKLYKGPEPDDRMMDPKGAYSSVKSIPDYLNSLDAIHDAEETLIGDTVEHGVSQAIYCNELFKVMHPSKGDGGVSEFDKIHATAAQRAEAFLRTLGKWEGGAQ